MQGIVLTMILSGWLGAWCAQAVSYTASATVGVEIEAPAVEPEPGGGPTTTGGGSIDPDG